MKYIVNLRVDTRAHIEVEAGSLEEAVEKGLKPGERIVAVGGHKVTKGMTVEPAK